jgi:putative copper export protein
VHAGDRDAEGLVSVTYCTVLLLHVLGATVWVGGHLLLAVTVLPGAWRARDPGPIREFEARYEKIGLPALLVQVATGLWLALRLLPEPSGWLAADGIPGAVTAKLALLVATVALAIHARLVLIPTLRPDTVPALGAHIVGVTLLAVGMLVLGVSMRVGGV